MKNLLTFTTLLMVINFLPAQNSIDVYKPDLKEIGVSFQASGLQGLLDSPFSEVFDKTVLSLKYVKSDRLYYTLGLGFDINTSKSETKDSLFSFSSKLLNTITEKTSQSKISIIPGIEYHFGGTPRLDPYLGANLPIKYISSEVKTNTNETNGVNSDNKVISSKIEDVISNPGGFGFGLGLLVGFNYYLTDRFSIGLEYRIGFDWEKTGGSEKTTHKESINNAGTISNSSYENTNYSSESSFKGINNGILGLNVLYFFGEK